MNSGLLRTATTLTLATMLASCTTYRADRLQRKFRQNGDITSQLSRRNNSLIADHVAQNPQIYANCKSQQKLVRTVSENMSHQNQRDNSIGKIPYYKAGVIQVEQDELTILPPESLTRIYLLQNALKTTEFQNELSTLLSADLADVQMNNGYYPSEKGGVINIQNGRVAVQEIPSLTSMTKLPEGVTSKELNQKNGTYLTVPSRYHTLSFIGRFHFHAFQEFNPANIGPSISLDKQKWYGVGRDIGTTINQIHRDGESHQFLFTAVESNKVNVSYYGGYAEKNISPNVFVVSLGDYVIPTFGKIAQLSTAAQ